jgi:hypothetical protein
MAESYIGLQEPSTVTKSLRTITHDIAGSSGIVHQEVMTIGGAASSLALAAVSASTPASTTWGLVVRQATPSLSNLTLSTGLATSTAVALLSSAATTPFVAAFTLTSTDAGPITGGFYTGSTLRWPVTLWAAGGVANVFQAVSAPGYVFSGKADRPLSFNAGSSGVNVRIGLTYWLA